MHIEQEKILQSNVTILLPVRNGQKYVGQSISNLKSVARANDEILIVEDGSTDASAKLLLEQARTDPRIRIINGKGKGLVHGLNLGIRESVNELIARADIDDLYSLDRIPKQLGLLASDVGAVFSDYKFQSANGIFLGTIPGAVTPTATSLSLYSGQRTAHPSVLYKKSAVITAGGYLEHEFPVEDLGLWIRLAQISSLVTCPETLLQYTIAKGSVSHLKKHSMIKVKHQLLMQHRLSSDELNEFANGFQELLKIYDESKLSTSRKILIYRDLRLATQFGMKHELLEEITQKLRGQLLFDLGAIKSLSNLAVTKSLRGLYRGLL